MQSTKLYQTIYRINFCLMIATLLIGCTGQPASDTGSHYDSASMRYGDFNHTDAEPASAGQGLTNPDSSTSTVPVPMPNSSGRLAPSGNFAVDQSPRPTNRTDQFSLPAMQSPGISQVPNLSPVANSQTIPTTAVRRDGAPTVASNESSTLPTNTSASSSDIGHDARTSSQNGRHYASVDLNRLILKYNRAKKAAIRSDESYAVNHMMTFVKSLEFLMRDTPQSFNTLPEKDLYAFSEFQRAADDLVPELEYYLEEFASETEKPELSALLEEARSVIEMEPPGTGNALIDFLQHLKKLNEQTMTTNDSNSVVSDASR